MNKFNADAFQASVFQSLGNHDELPAIKAKAKQLLSTSLTPEQRTLVLNTITLVNEILLNDHIEQLEDGDAIKAAYQTAKNASYELVTRVNKEPPEDLTGQFTAAITEAHAPQEALTMLDDVMYYGLLSLTQQANHNIHEKIKTHLQTVDGESSILPTSGDGNCLYNALSTCDAVLEGAKPDKNLLDFTQKTENHAKEKRAAAVQHMKTNWEQMGIDQNAFQNHSRSGIWGTDIQIRALAAAEKKPILVLKYDPSISAEVTGTIYTSEKKDISPDNLRVIVNYSNVHYDAIYTTRAARETLMGMYNVVPG